MNQIELLMRRRLVQAFIDADAVSVAFTRQIRTGTLAGGWVEEPAQTLAPQSVRLLVSRRRYGNPFLNTEAGQVEKWPYLILGRYTLDIAPDDLFTWNGGNYQVKAIEANTIERVLASADYLGGV